MKIGLYFGSFNPLHMGHLIIANHMHQFAGLDKICFVVSPQNPLKPKDKLLSEHHRLEMVKRALEKDDRFEVSDIEFKLPKPSYTITTLNTLREKFPDQEFEMIMGSDNLQSFPMWKDYEKILEFCMVNVYKRENYFGGQLANHPKIRIFDSPRLDISSTHIRNCILQGKSIRYLVPDEVLSYIEEQQVYKEY